MHSSSYDENDFLRDMNQLSEEVRVPLLSAYNRDVEDLEVARGKLRDGYLGVSRVLDIIHEISGIERAEIVNIVRSQSAVSSISFLATLDIVRAFFVVKRRESKGE